MIGSSVFSAVYGLSERDAPIVERINAHAVRIASTGADNGRYLVDAVPALSRLPSWIVPGKREALEWYARETDMFTGLNGEVRKRMVSADIDLYLASVPLWLTRVIVVHLKSGQRGC